VVGSTIKMIVSFLGYNSLQERLITPVAEATRSSCPVSTGLLSIVNRDNFRVICMIKISVWKYVCYICIFIYISVWKYVWKYESYMYD
jgi:hypothetical protein